MRALRTGRTVVRPRHAEDLREGPRPQPERAPSGRYVEALIGGRRCSGGVGCSRPAWVVTAPHMQPRHVQEREPWGVSHLKLNGDVVTACGRSAASWFVFWDHDFGVDVPGSCRACLSAVNDFAGF